MIGIQGIQGVRLGDTTLVYSLPMLFELWWLLCEAGGKEPLEVLGEEGRLFKVRGVSAMIEIVQLSRR